MQSSTQAGVCKSPKLPTHGAAVTGSGAEPKQINTGKETARGHLAKKSSSKQSKSRLFSDTTGEQPNPEGLGQTEVEVGNITCVWRGGQEEKSGFTKPTLQLQKQCCLP